MVSSLLWPTIQPCFDTVYSIYYLKHRPSKEIMVHSKWEMLGSTNCGNYTFSFSSFFFNSSLSTYSDLGCKGSYFNVWLQNYLVSLNHSAYINNNNNGFECGFDYRITCIYCICFSKCKE